MSKIERLMAKVQQVLEEERHLEKKLDDFVDFAANSKVNQAPGFAKITLLQCDTMRAKLEKSRRFWQKLTKILCLVVVGLIILLILK